MRKRRNGCLPASSRMVAMSSGCWTAFASVAAKNDAGWLLHGHSTACNACCTSAILRPLKLH